MIYFISNNVLTSARPINTYEVRGRERERSRERGERWSGKAVLQREVIQNL